MKSLFGEGGSNILGLLTFALLITLILICVGVIWLIIGSTSLSDLHGDIFLNIFN